MTCRVPLHKNSYKQYETLNSIHENHSKHTAA